MPCNYPDARIRTLRRWGLWPVVLFLAGYALFCHGDEDNELFVRADLAGVAEFVRIPCSADGILTNSATPG